MDFEDSRNEPSTKDYEIPKSNMNSSREETREKELSKARKYIISQIKPFAQKCVRLGPYWDLNPTFYEFCRHVLTSAPDNTTPTCIIEVLNDYDKIESFAKSKKESTPLMQEILRIYEQEKRTFEMESEASRNEISAQQFESVISSINSVREQELLKAREYVISQIKPFYQNFLQQGLDPNWHEFYSYVKDNAYGVDGIDLKLNHAFVKEVLDECSREEFFAKRKNETSKFMKKMLSIYEQEKRAFETQIQQACCDVLQLIINGKFVIQKDTNNCIQVKYATKNYFNLNQKIYISIANEYLQKFCPKNIQKLSLKKIDLSGWTLEITK